MSSNHRMTSLLTRLLPAFFVIASAPWLTVQAAHQGQEIIGEWKLTSVLDGVEITSIDETQAKRLIGKVMTIQKDGIKFGTERCGAPSFDSIRVEPNQYVLQEAHISAVKLRLPDPVTVVDIGCSRVFIKKANEVVIFWDGFFFGAKKIGTSRPLQR